MNVFEIWRNLKRWQQWALVAAVLIAVGYYVFSNYKSTNYSVLYSNLSSQDSQAMKKELAASGISYQTQDTDKTILVETSQVASVKMKLAMAGLPHSGNPGFELFDTNDIGATKFEKDVKYQRALKGQLENDLVRGIGVIERATVQLSLADDASIFQNSGQQESKATVSLGLKNGTQLEDSQIKGIQNLVSAAVKNLKAANVVVLDESGALLSDGSGSGSAGSVGSMSKQLQIVSQTENRIKDDIMKSLSAVFGYNNVRVNVRAQVNFDEIAQNIKKYDPQGTLLSQHKKTTESSQNGVTVNKEPGTQTNAQVPNYSVSANGNGQTSSSKSDELIQNFNVGEVVETVKKYPELTNLNVVVWVDKTMSADEVARLKKAVTVSAGITKNGEVEIVPVVFNQNAAARTDQDAKAQAATSFFAQNKTAVLAAIVGAIFLIGALFAFFASRRQEKASMALRQQMLESQAAASERAVQMSAARLSGEENQFDSDSEEARARKKTKKEEATEQAERDPDRTTEYVKRAIEE